MDSDLANESNHENDRPRMSIKDRIRAMNLDSGQRNTGHIRPLGSLPRTRFGERGTNHLGVSADCDLSTLKTTRNKQKPSGLMSDPGVGCDSHTVAAAINMWRRRTEEEKSKDKPKGLKEDNTEEDTKSSIFNLSKQKKASHDEDFRNENTSSLSRSPIHHTNEGAFVKPKLKPVRRAPHTLKLIQEQCARQYSVTVEKTESKQVVSSVFNPMEIRQTMISDRIKVYNSAKNGSHWKPVAPPIHLGQSKRIQSTKHSNLDEDASIDSSERQSLDEDSTSHCTPRLSGNSARMLVQPPTPSSYVSDSVYTAASSGEGAVVGSVGSSQQMNPIENRYAAMSTPETSIAGNDDSSGTSSKQQQIYPMRMLKPQPPTSVRPHMKNSLQSKLEYDKARAIRRSMLVRKQKKIPNNNVLVQKQDQDPTARPIKGGVTSVEITQEETKKDHVVQTKKTDGRLEKFLSPSARSNLPLLTNRLDAIRNRNSESPVVMDAPDDEAADMSPAVRSQNVKSLCESKPSERSLRSKSNEKIPMKADAMKEIIRRRRRRKEFQAGKTDKVRENEKSPIQVNENKKKLVETEIYSSFEKTKATLQDTKCTVTCVSENVKASRLPTVNEKVEVHKDAIPNLSASGGVPEVSLPPEIQRATKNGYYSKGTAEKQDIIADCKHSSSESNPMVPSAMCYQSDPDVIDHAALVDNSISVASSLMHDECSSDYNEDEPEPVVDSFMIELSPIKSQDISKHNFDTSTIYQDSPSSYSPFKQHKIIDENIESTPRRVNRNVSTTYSNGSSLHGSSIASGANALPPTTMSTPCVPTYKSQSNECFSENKLEPADEKLSSKCDSKDSVSMVSSCLDAELKCTKLTPTVNDAVSEASSGIRSMNSVISAISSVFSTNSSKANKILSERRSKASTEDKTHAIDLARKIMNGRSQHGSNTSIVDKDCVSGSKRHIEDGENDSNKIINEARQKSSEALKIEIEANHLSNNESLKLNDGNDEVVGGVSQSTESSILAESTVNTDGYDTNQSFNTNNVSTSVETGGEPYCFKYSFLHMDKIPNISEICGDMNKLELSNSLNTSAISAVRISQQNDDDDTPFDEEVAIEVEYLTNEDMGSLTSQKKKTDEIMMRIPTSLSTYPMTNIFISGTHYHGLETEHTSPNYVSESSCENETSGELSISVQHTESQQV